MINGDSIGPILLGRRLRQGDLLFPYLFILCIEGLSALLRYKEMRRNIHGVKVCRGSHILSHLLFVDDYFLLPEVRDIFQHQYLGLPSIIGK